MSRWDEIRWELREVLDGRSGQILDATLPPIAFLLGRYLCCTDLGLQLAALMALLVALIRLMMRQPIIGSLVGLAAAGLAGALAILSVRATNFFLPGLVSSGLVAAACIISLLVKRPLAAWTSYGARRWPLQWYRHPQVAPAYRNVTIAWALIFTARFLMQYSFFIRNAADALAASQLLLGWPLILLLLILSYLYGTWELRRQGGPSVQEFLDGAKPPWQSQTRGF